jgi:hypothetical protein
MFVPSSWSYTHGNSHPHTRTYTYHKYIHAPILVCLSGNSTCDTLIVQRNWMRSCSSQEIRSIHLVVLRTTVNVLRWRVQKIQTFTIKIGPKCLSKVYCSSDQYEVTIWHFYFSDNCLQLQLLMPVARTRTTIPKTQRQGQTNRDRGTPKSSQKYALERKSKCLFSEKSNISFWITWASKQSSQNTWKCALRRATKVIFTPVRTSSWHWRKLRVNNASSWNSLA